MSKKNKNMNTGTLTAIAANQSYVTSDLKKTYDSIFSILNIESGETISEDVNKIIFSQKLPEYLKKYRKFVSDFEFEPLIKAYQFYAADREGKKQDFTPVSLSKLISRIMVSPTDNIIMDMCCGLAALSLQIKKETSGKRFIMIELDEKEIPVLLFIMAAYSMDGWVVNENILTHEIFNTYKVENSVITVEMLPTFNKPTVVVSNPPFNLKYVPIKEFLPINTNYQFIYEGIERSSDNARLAFILPTGVLNSQIEKKARKWLIDNNLLDAVITMPDNMFDETGVSTCVLLINKNKNYDKVTLIDHSKKFEYEIIKKQGEGTNRIYSKTKNYLSDHHISGILRTLYTGEDCENAVTVENEDIVNRDYTLNPSIYIPDEITEDESRPIEHIINDLERVAIHRNNVKLTLNETIARKTGFDKIFEAMKEGNEKIKSTNDFLEFMGLKTIPESKYMQLTKLKNEVKFEQDKSLMSSFMEINLATWKHQVHYLNTEENRLLAELRDCLLPKLMNGEIDVSNLNSVNTDGT